MIPRSLMLAGMLGAAVGVPYAVSNAPDGWQDQWGSQWSNWNQTASAPADTTFALGPLAAPNAASPTGPGSNLYQSFAPLEGVYGRSLGELLNWGITKEWVYRNWDRKSTGLADPQLFGIRVPVVTGAAMTDVAGSLSYYFDAQGVLQKIRLHGRSADTTQLVRLAAERFRMSRRTSLSPGDQLFQSVEKNRLRSELRTRPESVLWGTTPHSSFVVDMEVNRPGSNRWVTPPMTPKLDLSGVTAKTNQPRQVAGVPPVPRKRPLGTPVFPSRTVVPDDLRQPTSALTEAEQAAITSTNRVNAMPVSQGSVTNPPVKHDSSLAPLEGYRERFRWPN